MKFKKYVFVCHEEDPKGNLNLSSSSKTAKQKTKQSDVILSIIKTFLPRDNRNSNEFHKSHMPIPHRLICLASKNTHLFYSISAFSLSISLL